MAPRQRREVIDMYCMSTNTHKEMCGLYGTTIIQREGRKYYVCQHHLNVETGRLHNSRKLPSNMAVIYEDDKTIYINRITYEETIVSRLPFHEESNNG